MHAWLSAVLMIVLIQQIKDTRCTAHIALFYLFSCILLTCQALQSLAIEDKSDLMDLPIICMS